MLGGFLKSVGGALGIAPVAPQFHLPAALPDLRARSGADLVLPAGLSVAPGAPDPASQTPAQFLSHKLNVERDMLGATQALAHSLPEKKCLQWATDCAEMVAHKLSPAQKSALTAARAFQANPSIATREAAAASAVSAGPHGPGGLAAKAASFAAVPGVPPVPGGEKLVAVCVAGAVVLAAALSPRSAPNLVDLPAAPNLDMPRMAALVKSSLAPSVSLPRPGSPEALKNAAAFKPFIDRGLALAAG